MREINLKFGNLENYREYLESNQRVEIENLSKELEGLNIAFINSTSFGGGVSEIFYSILPLLKSLKINIHWYTIDGDRKFFNITKKLHNNLQGKSETLNSEDIDYYIHVNERNAKELDNNFDIVVVHDPQPMPLPAFFKNKGTKWVWRCHIDTSSPSSQGKEIISKFLPLYQRTIFSMDEFAKGLNCENNSTIIYPSIDPFSEKNKFLYKDESIEIVKNFGVNVEKPILLQVSRFDPWKDPLGVIDVYRKIKKKFSKIQLVLIGSMATDDPEGWKFYEKTLRYAGMDENIFIFTNFDGVGNIEVNAFQREATVVLQKSIREGFGLTVSEAMWKKKPVVGGNVGGIRIQIKDGENGYLVNSKEEACYRVEELLSDEEKMSQFGEKGHLFVKKNFLTPRHVLDYLKLFKYVIF